MTFLLHRWTAPAVLAILLATAVQAAPVGSGADPKKNETAAEKVRKALDEIVDVTIEKQPFTVAIDQLREQSKINFVVDTLQIQNQVGDLQGTEVNVKLSGVKMRSVLRTVLAQHNLGYAVIGDTVLITTEDLAMYRQVRQRVSVDVDKLPFEKALKQLGKETGTNLLLDSRVSKEAQNPVSLQVDDVPLDTAVKLLAHMSGLRTVRVGNVLFVTSKETADEMRQDADLMGPVPPNGPPRADEAVPGAPGRVQGIPFQLVQPQGFVVPAAPVQAVPPNPPPATDPPKEDKKDKDSPNKPDEKKDKDPPKPEDKPK